MEGRRVFVRSAITVLLFATSLVIHPEYGPKSQLTDISQHGSTPNGLTKSVNSSGSINVAAHVLQSSRHSAGSGARGKRFLSSRLSYYANADSSFQLTRIASSGDVSPNPGPAGEGNNPAKCPGCNRTIADEIIESLNATTAKTCGTLNVEMSPQGNTTISTKTELSNGPVRAQAYQTVFVRSQHAPYKYSNFLANRYCKYLSFLKSAFTAVYLQ